MFSVFSARDSIINRRFKKKIAAAGLAEKVNAHHADVRNGTVGTVSRTLLNAGNGCVFGPATPHGNAWTVTKDNSVIWNAWRMALQGCISVSAISIRLTLATIFRRDVAVAEPFNFRAFVGRNQGELVLLESSASRIQRVNEREVRESPGTPSPTTPITPRRHGNTSCTSVKRKSRRCLRDTAAANPGMAIFWFVPAADCRVFPSSAGHRSMSSASSASEWCDFCSATEVGAIDRSSQLLAAIAVASLDYSITVRLIVPWFWVRIRAALLLFSKFAGETAESGNPSLGTRLRLS